MTAHDCHIEGHIERASGECTRCVGGVIELPAGLYNPAEIACPWCRGEEYPDGFPGCATPCGATG